MANNEGQEKTEDATSKKLSDSRDEGQVAKSQEMSSFLIFSGGFFILFAFRDFISDQISGMTTYVFRSLDVLTININIVQLYFYKALGFFALTMAPILLGLMVIGFVSNVGQIGFKISLKAMKPKMSKFNLAKGIKRIFFSSRSLVEVAKSLAKLFVIGLFTYIVLDDLIQEAVLIIDHSIAQIVVFMIESALTLIWKLALVFAVIAAADFIFQRHKHKKDLKMSKQEVKDEGKQTDGDPQVKARIKSIQFETARKRMMQDVPNADVVITNPTHYAIAIKYDQEKNAAPRILAKGVDTLAQRIKKVATENGVPLHENRELARALYKVADVGDEIPSELFQAVAQILAHIFRQRNSRKSIV
jgi:flagellar biosynthetic protein FlhB